MKNNFPLLWRGIEGEAVGVRTRAIEKKLKNVEGISNEEVKTILPELLNGELLNDEK